MAYSFFIYLIRLWRTFRIWDDNGDRKLSFEEFAKGIQDYGAVLNPGETRKVFDLLDKDGSGSIDYDELLIALRVSTMNTWNQIIEKGDLCNKIYTSIASHVQSEDFTNSIRIQENG